MADLARVCGIVENTLYRWKSKYVGMEVSEAKRLRELEQENVRLKRLLAKAELDKSAMKELIEGMPMKRGRPSGNGSAAETSCGIPEEPQCERATRFPHHCLQLLSDMAAAAGS